MWACGRVGKYQPFDPEDILATSHDIVLTKGQFT